MIGERVIAILDIGKTNKKALLFNEDYKIVYEQAATIREIVDEDGDVCEDVNALIEWASTTVANLISHPNYEVVAINFSAYGASWVFIDRQGKIIPPLYNYLKPLPPVVTGKLWNLEEEAAGLCRTTRSPFLGSLNAGLQLLRLKLKKPARWENIAYALSLPQFFCWYFTKKPISEITSIGCHTMMWDFDRHQYADWVIREDLTAKLPAIESAEKIMGHYKGIPVGAGIHDSSAALIPYLLGYKQPFLLLSTGTWNICMNPFSKERVTLKDLSQDCLSYLAYNGKPVFSSRLFAGNYHDENVRLITEQFKVPVSFYKEVEFDPAWKPEMNSVQAPQNTPAEMLRKLNTQPYENLPDAYHALIFQLIQAQKKSIELAARGEAVTNLYVEGGFSKNQVFMKMLAHEFPKTKVYAASIPQATALGAALVLHGSWNPNNIPQELVRMKRYTSDNKN